MRGPLRSLRGGSGAICVRIFGKCPLRVGYCIRVLAVLSHELRIIHDRVPPLPWSTIVRKSIAFSSLVVVVIVDDCSGRIGSGSGIAMAKTSDLSSSTIVIVVVDDGCRLIDSGSIFVMAGRRRRRWRREIQMCSPSCGNVRVGEVKNE
jgi:hypothetical protein